MSVLGRDRESERRRHRSEYECGVVFAVSSLERVYWREAAEAGTVARRVQSGTRSVSIVSGIQSRVFVESREIMDVLKPFQLVNFIDEADLSGQRSVECVPNSWINYDKELGSCVTRYMAPPYKPEDKKLIRTLIKNRTDPPESWPEYRVTLLGHAETHAEGMKRVEKLSKQEYAYTTTGEDAGEIRSKKITEHIKNKKSNDADAINDLLCQKKLSSDSDGNDSGDTCRKSSDKETSSDSDAIGAKFRGKKKKNLNTKKAANQSAAQIKKKTKNGNSSKSVTPHQFNRENDANANKTRDSPISSTRHALPTNESRISKNTANKNPVLDLNGNDPVQHTLIRIMTSVQSQNEEIRDLRRSIERFMKTPSSEMTPDCFMKKYGVQKISSNDDFQVFDGQLIENADFLKDFKSAIDCIVESEMKKTLNAIVKKFFTQQFAMNCTTVRESKKNTKLMLKGTAFYEKLFEFLRQMHSKEEDVTEKTFYKSLSSCLNNAKDWDGGRKMRAQTKN